MKKVFSLVDSIKKPDRIADQIKFEVKKYIKRERNKKLPEKVDFWDFDCRIGPDENSAVIIHVSKISESISEMVKDSNEEFYLEVLSKPGVRLKKTKRDHKAT